MGMPVAVPVQEPAVAVAQVFAALLAVVAILAVEVPAPVVKAVTSLLRMPMSVAVAAMPVLRTLTPVAAVAMPVLETSAPVATV
jgi:hypothetical protein